MNGPAPAAPSGEIIGYYRNPHVRRRLAEYLNPLGEDESPTAASVAGIFPGCCPLPVWDVAPSHPLEEFEQLLGCGADVARSMLDRRVLVVHLDLDYQNCSHPDEPFVRPAETFRRMEGAYLAVTRVLERFELPALTLMTGRGYHFSACVPLDAPIVDELAALSPQEPGWYATRSRRVPPGLAHYDSRTSRAYTGMGLVLEYLAHLVLGMGSGKGALPIVLNGTVVGNVSCRGRECASVDISFAGDPIDVRSFRCAFSSYQLHRLRPDIFGADAASRPPMAAVPRESGLDAMFSRRTLAGAADAARDDSARMPVCTDGFGNVLAEYLASPLGAFHRRFYAVEPHPPVDWPRTYDKEDLLTWPPCVGAAIRAPNDLLLQPAHVQHLTRALSEAGWHARHIAGLIWSRYARDCGWGDRWTRRMDARTRAEFDVRVFAGLIATGLDRGLDFNCVSALEKGLCPGGTCGRDLTDIGRRLRAAKVP